MITIKMPQASLDKWLEALESGEYKQGRGALLDEDGNYCCLGVLQHCLCGRVEINSKGFSLAVPSQEWIKENNIYFDLGRKSDNDKTYVSPFLPSLGLAAHCANDVNVSFREIAAAIRLCSEGV